MIICEVILTDKVIRLIRFCFPSECRGHLVKGGAKRAFINPITNEPCNHHRDYKAGKLTL